MWLLWFCVGYFIFELSNTLDSFWSLSDPRLPFKYLLYKRLVYFDTESGSSNR